MSDGNDPGTRAYAISPVPLKGWLILKPKRHVEHLAALNPDEAQALGPLIEKVSRAMMTALVSVACSATWSPEPSPCKGVPMRG